VCVCAVSSRRVHSPFSRTSHFLPNLHMVVRLRTFACTRIQLCADLLVFTRNHMRIRRCRPVLGRTIVGLAACTFTVGPVAGVTMAKPPCIPWVQLKHTVGQTRTSFLSPGRVINCPRRVCTSPVTSLPSSAHPQNAIHNMMRNTSSPFMSRTMWVSVTNYSISIHRLLHGHSLL
jgi:hypothetical protein